MTATRSQAPWYLLLAAVVAPAATVFVFPMLSLIARNEEYFGGDYFAGRYLFGVGALALALGLGAWFASRATAGRFIFYCYLLVTPGFALYTLFAGPNNEVAAAIAFVAVLVAAALLMPLPAARVLSPLGLVCVVLLIGSAVSTGVEIGSGGDSPVSAEGRAPDGPPPDRSGDRRLPSVYHLTFDEFQTDMFMENLDDEVRRALSGFTFYPEARTPYGRTEMAVASILAASDYDYERPAQEYVDDAFFSEESSLRALTEAGYRTTGYVPNLLTYRGRSPFEVAYEDADTASSYHGRDYVDLATSLWVYSNLPKTVSRRAIPSRHFEQLEHHGFLPDDAPALALESFRTFVQRERNEPDHGRYTLVHVMVPHFPNVLTRDCHYVTDRRTTPVEQAGCAVNMMREAIEELQRLDRFTGSTIIMHGDHGRAPIGDIFGENFNTARSRSLLLVKPAGVDASAPLRESDQPAMVTDIMPTIFDASGLTELSQPGRTSLLDEDFPARPVRYYHMYDKAENSLPDGELKRYAIRAGRLTFDRNIAVP